MALSPSRRFMLVIILVAIVVWMQLYMIHAADTRTRILGTMKSPPPPPRAPPAPMMAVRGRP
ncbi:hypothetical protein PanWU01x14_244990 [Parasponia andersonii]|uniref:Transmembrane protein n=1 Tax=Parasponia andersonii TaxID=3476 RepID=A0A2P5BEV7_PARAD|nr:hypothetical protein PanWU01x14_244990 [Parasponia andersonii]